MDLGLAGKTALVTGSDRGTGQVIAETLKQEGAIVLTHGTGAGDANVDFQADIATEQGCNALLSALDGQQIDILVNNYGTTNGHKWDDTDTAKWLEMYETNALSAARMAQGLMQGMKDRGWGRIINLGTIGSHQPNKIMPAYYASKGALANMGASLALALANTGITVNTIAPGLILTPEVEAFYKMRAKKKGWGDDWEAGLCREEYPNPTGRIARREEVADLVAFIASDRAACINGQNIRIDGGAVRYV